MKSLELTPIALRNTCNAGLRWFFHLLSSLLFLIASFVSLGCARSTTSKSHSNEEEVAQQCIGEYQLTDAYWDFDPTPPKDRHDPYWEKPLLCLSANHTFQFADFPARLLPMLPNSGETWLNCEGEWQARADGWGFVFHLVVTKVNGKTVDNTLFFRPGGESFLVTKDQRQIARFKRKDL